MAKVIDEVKIEEQRKEGLATAVEQIREKFGDGSIMKLKEARTLNVASIPTGPISLDLALGVGGIPKGRVIEIFGPESSGKTTLAMHMVAEAQNRGGQAAFVDAEHALDPDYAEKIGVKLDDVLISQPDTGEQALDIVETLVRSNAVDVIVVDSVAALTPRAEIEGEMGDSHMGLHARLMSQALRKLAGIISKSRSTVIFINQIRMKIGVMFGCLNYKSAVNIAEDKNQWIGRIVNQKRKVNVLTYDWKKREIISRPVIGWFNNGPVDKFLQITTYKPSGNGKAQIACTYNHPILTPVGWRRAEELKVGDKVLVGIPYRLNAIQMEIIRGSLLGDGALSLSASKSLGIRFRLGHGKKQEAYLKWKAFFFSNIKQTITKNKKGDIFCDLTPLPELYSLRQEMYVENYKVLTPEFIASLTPLSLAIWYMDDGHLDIRDKGKTKGRITICIEKIEPKSRVLLKHHLATKYGIETRLGRQGYKAVLFFDQHNSDQFMQLVRRYIHPSMKYKLLSRHHYYFSLKPVFSTPVWKPITLPVIDIHQKPRTRSMMRFDIGVRKTHNFLADGIIVHNSPETTTGGQALKFYSSVRLEVRKIAQIKQGDRIIGNRVKVKVVKNKVAPPFRIAEFDLMWNEGISYEGDVLDTGVEYGAITKSGNSYIFGEDRLGVGRENAKQFLRENPKVAASIDAAIRKAAKEKQAGE